MPSRQRWCQGAFQISGWFRDFTRSRGKTPVGLVIRSPGGFLQWQNLSDPTLQGYSIGAETIVWLSRCQWSTPEAMCEIGQYLMTTTRNKTRRVCIIIGMHCPTMHLAKHSPLIKCGPASWYSSSDTTQFSLSALHTWHFPLRYASLFS